MRALRKSEWEPARGPHRGCAASLTFRRDPCPARLGREPGTEMSGGTIRNSYHWLVAGRRFAFRVNRRRQAGWTAARSRSRMRGIQEQAASEYRRFEVPTPLAASSLARAAFNATKEDAMTATQYSLLVALVFALVAFLQIARAVMVCRLLSGRLQFQYGRVGLPLVSRSSWLVLDMQHLKADLALN